MQHTTIPADEIHPTIIANEELFRAIKSKKPFSYIRPGHTEALFIYSLLNKIQLNQQWLNALHINAGVFPTDERFLMESFLPANLSAIYSADFLSFVRNASLDPMNQFRKLQVRATFLEPSWVSDPLVLWHLSNSQHKLTPWTSLLKEKTVLFITPFLNTFIRQLKVINRIWSTEQLKLLAPYKSATIIQSPFSPTVQGYSICDHHGRIAANWAEQLTILKHKMANMVFDVALIGAGAYGPALAEFAKCLGKVGITTSGNTQLFYGVKMYRTKNLPEHINGTNEYWLEQPLEIDIPRNSHLVNSIERSYW